jgi:hypothetical protein
MESRGESFGFFYFENSIINRFKPEAFEGNCPRVSLLTDFKKNPYPTR